MDCGWQLGKSAIMCYLVQAVRPQAKAPVRAPRRDRDRYPNTRRPHRRSASPDAMHQVRLPRMPSLCRSRCKRRGQLQPMPAGRRRRCRATRCVARQTGDSAQFRQRRRKAAAVGGYRRTSLHRLHVVHAGLSGRCNSWRTETDAYGDRRALYRLRFVCAALPRRLHRLAAGHGRSDRLGCMEPGAGRRRSRAPRPARGASRTRARGCRSTCCSAASRQRCHCSGYRNNCGRRGGAIGRTRSGRCRSQETRDYPGRARTCSQEKRGTGRQGPRPAEHRARERGCAGADRRRRSTPPPSRPRRGRHRHAVRQALTAPSRPA